MNFVKKRIDVFVCSEYICGKLQRNFYVRFRINCVVKTGADKFPEVVDWKVCKAASILPQDNWQIFCEVKDTIIEDKCTNSLIWSPRAWRKLTPFRNFFKKKNRSAWAHVWKNFSGCKHLLQKFIIEITSHAKQIKSFFRLQTSLALSQNLSCISKPYELL